MVEVPIIYRSDLGNKFQEFQWSKELQLEVPQLSRDYHIMHYTHTFPQLNETDPTCNHILGVKKMRIDLDSSLFLNAETLGPSGNGSLGNLEVWCTTVTERGWKIIYLNDSKSSKAEIHNCNCHKIHCLETRGIPRTVTLPDVISSLKINFKYKLLTQLIERGQLYNSTSQEIKYIFLTRTLLRGTKL